MSKTQLERAPAGYDTDVCEWCLETAALIRNRSFDEIDLKHVAEEIEDMGKRDKREVVSRLKVLVINLLKWQAQPDKRGPSWQATIHEQRDQLELVQDDSPSLARITRHDLPKIYLRAVTMAVDETGLGARFFPRACPYTAEQILRDDFFPE